MSSLEIVLTIVSILASICAVWGFVSARKKEQKTDIQTETQFEQSMLSNQQQMMNSINELRLDIRENSKKQDDINGRVIRLEEKVDSLDSRLKHFEEK